MLNLSAEQKERGVIAASAGNHALALAAHGGKLGIPVTVVMPTIAPLAKVERCRELGATVVLHGDNIQEARGECGNRAEWSELTYINGFDDPDIIAGAGTMGLEIAEQVPDFDAVVVPCGGGGLLAGVALALKVSAPCKQTHTHTHVHPFRPPPRCLAEFSQSLFGRIPPSSHFNLVDSAATPYHVLTTQRPS